MTKVSVISNKNEFTLFNSDIKFVKNCNNLYNVSICGIDYETDYELIMRYNGINYSQRDLSSLKGSNDLVNTLKRCFNNCLLKHNVTDFFGSYEIFLKYKDKRLNRKIYIHLFTYEIYEGYITVNSCLEDSINFLDYHYVILNKAYDYIGKICLNKDSRIFESEYLDLNFCALINQSIPNKRKSSKCISDKKKAKILEHKTNDKILRDKENFIKKDYNIKDLSYIKSFKFNEILSFYDYVIECLNDINLKLNISFVDNLNSVKFNKGISYGSYSITYKSITINNKVIKLNDKTTFYHEFGHHIYHCLCDGNDKVKKNLIKEFIKEIRCMETIKKIRDIKKNFVDLNKKLKEEGSKKRYSISYYNYLLDESEIFARIFEYYLGNNYNISKKTIIKENWKFTNDESLLFEKYLIKLGLLK